MTAPRQSPKRKEIRVSLHAVMNRVADLDQHSLSEGAIPRIMFSSMILDEKSQSRPIFFAPYPAASIQIPDDNLEYWDFELLEGNWRTPIKCARAIYQYLGYYTILCPGIL